MKVRFGPIFTVFLVATAIIGVSAAFIANASPYVTVSEARKSGARNVYLKGELDKSSIHNDLSARTINFQLKDKNGETAHVVYTGPPPQDMNQATEVVAEGSMKDGKFYSSKLLIKCPSKYEGVQQIKS